MVIAPPGFKGALNKILSLFKCLKNMENLQQLEQQIAELSAKLEDLKKQAEEKEAAFPKSIKDLPNQMCYYVNWNGQIKKGLDDNPDFVDLPTHAHAVSQRAANQLMNLIYHINGGQVYPDGYAVMFDKDLPEKLDADMTVCGNVFLKFNMVEDLKKSIKIHRNLWMEYFTGEEQPK